MKKIISFSLWGNIPMYIQGAFENISLAQELYPDWVCRFYVNNTVSNEVVGLLIKRSAEVYLIKDNLGAFWGMFWRFFANDDEDAEIFISRDCDSRISERERAAVQEWQDSDKLFHTMHDNHGHRSVPVLGGMWGAKRGCIKSLREKIYRWGSYGNKGIDQEFLSFIVWPEVRGNSINHSSLAPELNVWSPTLPFPAHKESRFGKQYVGEIFDEYNNHVVP